MSQETEENVWASRFLPPPEPPPEVTPAPEYDPIVGNREFLMGVQDSSKALADQLRATEPEPVPPPVKVSQRTLWLVPASGGAGVSTLISLLGEHVVDATMQPPVWSGRAIIVAPTHEAGLTAAEQLARAKARGELVYDVMGIIWVHDRPKLSDTTARETRRIGAMFPKLWSMPYEATWREPGNDKTPSRHNTKLLIRSLNKLTTLKEKKS